ncbi:hypothetical protein A3A70_02815 [candidate division WWE3 bacterium RIFCSPLOWO2_01_FULL_42_11]|uniref:Uncharacterized protein n=1 Tax=candidate division WWE3 bacterium RIFCSPLOWO2_01_FULL_42_11 TaxID=1802627 RepID=A0A1F4VLL4_UNCKA|nr:MAG: hypothetical protein A3A70_02815 [candidate division WWE3 bacterium RIFCSPLOWO2_01_FULL_42_11]
MFTLSEISANCFLSFETSLLLFPLVNFSTSSMFSLAIFKNSLALALFRSINSVAFFIFSWALPIWETASELLLVILFLLIVQKTEATNSKRRETSPIITHLEFLRP